MKKYIIVLVMLMTGCADFAVRFADGTRQSSGINCCRPGSGGYSYTPPPSYQFLQQCDINTIWCCKSAKEDNITYGYDSAMTACGDSNRLCKQNCSR